MCFILLAGSRSAGAVVVFGVMLGILGCRPLLLVAWRRHIPVSTVAIVAGSIIILTAVIERGFLLSLLGRGSSLSGRVPLWKLLYSLAAGHEWLGFGYASFWPQHAGRIWLIVHWTPHTAHNGYLDFYLSLGLIGLALFLAHTVVVLSRFMAAIKKDPTSPITYWMFMMFILVCLCNIFENELLIDNNFLWVFYVAMCSSSIAYKPQPRVVAVSSVSAKLMEACA
jgi:exopolysaccharide production protein ExoQ